MRRERMQAILATYGDGEATLRRPSQGGAPVTYESVTVACKALRTSEDELVGGTTQARRQFRLGNAEIEAAGWPGPPRQGDELVLRGKTYAVLACDTRAVRGEIWAHIVTVKG